MKFYKFLISLIIILTLSIHPALADDEEDELSHDFSSITVSSCEKLEISSCIGAYSKVCSSCVD